MPLRPKPHVQPYCPQEGANPTCPTPKLSWLLTLFGRLLSQSHFCWFFISLFLPLPREFIDTEELIAFTSWEGTWITSKKEKGVGWTVGSILFSKGYFHSAAESGNTFRLVLPLFGTQILNDIDFQDDELICWILCHLQCFTRICHHHISGGIWKATLWRKKAVREHVSAGPPSIIQPQPRNT